MGLIRGNFNMTLLGIVASGYRPPPRLSGGTLTSDATYYYYSWTSANVLVNPAIIVYGNLSVDYLCIGGGGGAGGGGGGGGGGAGGMLQGTAILLGNYEVIVGRGGNGYSTTGFVLNPDTGEQSYIRVANGGSNVVQVTGGGRGGGLVGVSGANLPLTGGSGGGGLSSQATGATGIVGQGNAGSGGSSTTGGGGGGADGAGSLGPSGGGAARASSLRGTGSVNYARGGGGGDGGALKASNLIANSGNGGNAQAVGSSTGEAGSTGLIVIRYLRSAVGG